MLTPNTRIIKFLHEHHVFALATSDQDVPYCANMFYVFMEEKNMLAFISEKKTRHIAEAEKNNKIAGAIALETETIGLIRGLQIQGLMYKPVGNLKRKATLAYLKRFPYALLKGSSVWVIELTFMKFTDNRLGFGKKIIWKKT